MKKMIRSLAALTALALLGAGLIACSSDDDKDPEPGVRIEGSTSVAVDGEITLTAKATDFSGDVTYTWESSDKTKATVTQDTSDPSKATVKGIAEGSAKITVEATDGTTTKTAEVTVTVGDAASGGALTAYTVIFSGYNVETLGCTISSDNKSANLEKIGEIDFKSDVSEIAATAYTKAAGNLRYRLPENEKISTALNFNGSSFTSNDKTLGATVDKGNLRTYISVPADGTGKITVTYNANVSGNGKTEAKIALFDENGTVLKSETVDTTTASGKTDTKTVSVDVTPETKNLYIMFSRENSTGGGIDVSKIEAAPNE